MTNNTRKEDHKELHRLAIKEIIDKFPELDIIGAERYLKERVEEEIRKILPPRSLTQNELDLANKFLDLFDIAVNKTITDEDLTKRLSSLQWSLLKEGELESIKECFLGYTGVEALCELIDSLFPRIDPSIEPLILSNEKDYRAVLLDLSASICESPLNGVALDIARAHVLS